MLQVEISASVRKVSGKGEMRRLRNDGITPAVIYGNDKEATDLQLDAAELTKRLLEVARKNAVINLSLDDGTVRNVLVKEVQTDPIRDTLLHTDFFEIDINKTRTFTVPLAYVGKAKGADLGGIVNVNVNAIQVEGLPLDIPEQFEIDITNLAIGDKIVLDSVAIADNITLLTDAGTVCVVVDKPKTAVEDDTAEDAAE